MGAIMQVTDKVKLVSSVGAGVTGLIEQGIPQAFQAAASRWVELLQSPLSAVGQGHNAQQVANTLAWVEKNAATVVPADLATRLTPQVLDIVAQSQKFARFIDDPNTPFKDIKGYAQKATDELKKAFELVKSETKKWLDANKDVEGFLPPGFDAGKIEKLAEAKATSFFNALVAAPPPPVYVAIPEVAYTPGDPGMTDQPPAPPLATPGQLDAVDFVAATVSSVIERENLHPPPPHVDLPNGWDDVFALGCLQQTDYCS
jgi:hypothetical protein